MIRRTTSVRRCISIECANVASSQLQCLQPTNTTLQNNNAVSQRLREQIDLVFMEEVKEVDLLQEFFRQKTVDVHEKEAIAAAYDTVMQKYWTVSDPVTVADVTSDVSYTETR